MRWAVLVSAAFWACAPSSRTEESLEVRSLRQAGGMPLTLPEVGPTGSLLGSSLAACPGVGFVAGAPGTGTGWHSPSGVIPPAQGDSLGRAVACVSAGTGNTEMIAGGDAGVRKAISGSWSIALGAGIVLSMSSSDLPQLPLLLGYHQAVALANPSNGQQVGSTLMGTNGYGAVVRWFPGEPRFAVTHAVGSTVAIYDFDPVGSAIDPVQTITNAAAGFGRSLAVGDVLPASPGNELIIGALNAVFIYRHDGFGPLMQLSGNNDSSFGHALATAPHSVGLDQLFVGAPASNAVHRFVGDAGEVYTSVTNNERFGASLAVNSGVLAIGAPDHLSGSGAVYSELLTIGSGMGEVQECQVGRACLTQQCMVGECVGGVFCDFSAPIFGCDPAAEACMNGRCVELDAGFVVRDSGVVVEPPDSGVIIDPDGGVVIVDGGGVMIPDASIELDAGDKFDAGRPDASVSFDAGRPDASVDLDAGSMDSGIVDPADSGVSPVVDAGVDAGVKPPKDAGSDQDGGVVDQMIFTTSGCSETGLLPILGLCLVLLRRRFR